ncbi:MAG: hypothetical protein JO210_00465 [Acidobacteriaceae bacterium]|nr:hypothetical protein [Acidobacteriaceae bacterium]
MKLRRVLLPFALTFSLMPGLVRAITFQVRGVSVGPWAAILGSVGIAEDAKRKPQIIVAGGTAPADLALLSEDHILILEGASAVSTKLGITSTAEQVAVRQIVDVHAPEMQIIWEHPENIARAQIPAGFKVFASEKWKGAPLIAGRRTPHGAVLWLAIGPGESGIERFPYLLQALADLGWSAPAQTTTLWAFFDSSYRIRADPDYLARRWRRAGIGVLHVAAWHNMEPDPTQDSYLKQLIEACHRNAISVYAWLELPHVSEKFWAEHSSWREKTAVGQDAQLDWRKLMNLQNAECRKEIGREINFLLGRFDWDGVNLAELYFESLEGAANPARFTPMNDDVRAEFKSANGFDPKLLFEAGSPYAAATHPEALRKFLDFRAELASRMQRRWLQTVDDSRASKPYLDVVLTHIDDRFEPGIRDELGADVARTLPLIEKRRSTLLVEDPATLWALGPERYARLADKYKQIGGDGKHLAVDINVVERYQDVYPTKKQTGVELLELFHQAAVSFGRVAVYFESSLEKQDLSILPAAATSAHVEESSPDDVDVDAQAPTRVAWQGPVEIDGKIWPFQNGDFVLAPSGKHRLSVAVEKPGLTINDFNGDIQSALATDKQIDVSYESRTRAIAVLSFAFSRIEVDGELYKSVGDSGAVLLPSGQHVVSFVR